MASRSASRLAFPLRFVLVAMLAAGLLGIGGAARAAEIAALEFSRISMGTRIRVVLYPPDGSAESRDSATAAVAAAFTSLDQLEAVLSDWRPDSELSRLSDAAGEAGRSVSAELLAALVRARAIAEATDGAFDPTVGPLSALWREAKRSGTAPTSEAIAAARALVDWRGLELDAQDPTRATARLARRGMRLDLGGIGKGIAVDALSRKLREAGFARHLVDFGSTQRAGDAPPERDAWSVEAGKFGTLLLCGAALAVSGDEEQALELATPAGPARISHIVDPRSGATGLGLTTPIRAAVIAEDAATADAVATALCVVGPSRAADLAARFGTTALSVRTMPTDGARAERFATPSFAESGERCASEGNAAARTVPAPMRRVMLPGNKARLEVAAMRFEALDRPTVTLVGVTHIGSKELYARIQALLDAHDLVLYESVMPGGIGGPAGADPEARAARTRESMTIVAELLERMRRRTKALPPTLDELPQATAAIDTRLVRLLPPLLVDGWSQPLEYERRFDAEGDPVDFVLRSQGSDLAPGGVGDAADIVMSRPKESGLDDEGLQADLAAALGLEFQLKAIDYSKPNFRFADMTAPEFVAALEARNIDDGGLFGTLAGTSFPARMVKMMLGVVKFADSLSGGAVAEMVKAVLVEAFADGEVLALADQQMGKEFMEVIVQERNAVALAGLRDVAPNSTVAIFYGAAHLPDFAARLEAEGYRLAAIEWIPAIEVDLTKAGMDQRQLAAIRKQIKGAVRKK